MMRRFKSTFPTSIFCVLGILNGCGRAVDGDVPSSVHMATQNLSIAPVSSSVFDAVVQLNVASLSSQDAKNFSANLIKYVDGFLTPELSSNQGARADQVEMQQQALLEEMSTLQRVIQEKVTQTVDSSARNILLETWNDLVEHEFAMRAVYGNSALSRAKSLLAQGNIDEALAFLQTIPAVGSIDAVSEMIRMADGQTAEEVRVGLREIFSRWSSSTLAVAFLYQDFVKSPSRTALERLVKVGLPLPVAMENLTALTNPTPKKGNFLKEGLSSALDFVVHDSDAHRAQLAQEKKKKEEDIRANLKRVVANLESIDPGVSKIAEPLLAPFVPLKDAEGYYAMARGVKFREGDLFLFRFGPTAFSWEIYTQSPARFSHVGIVSFTDDGRPFVADQGYSRVDFNSLDDALRRDAYTVVLHDKLLSSDQRKELQKSIRYFVQNGAPFDYRFDMDDSSAMYCSELIYNIYKHAGLVDSFLTFSHRSPGSQAFLKTMGVNTNRFLIQGSFLSDPRFAFVGAPYEHGAKSLYPARRVVQLTFAELAKAKHVDFAKVSNGFFTGALVDVFRMLKLNGLGSMTRELAWSVRNMDGSLSAVSQAVDARLEQEGYSLSRIEEYKAAVERIVPEEIKKAYEKVFVY